ncbi:MAG: hypothetical protein K0S11_1118 [Gammaproteobacteria bacterium]|jgi:hypothetical protein|nr:hypothetical protein [Gammaproteobacteria bacterium]
MLEKAKIVVLETRQEIPVMYNPTELSDSRSMVFSGEGANIQFHRTQQDNLTVSLIFDTYEKGSDVRNETRKIAQLVEPTQGNGDRKSPPVCLFSWSTIWFKGILIKLEQKFTLFLSSGIPVRAQLTATFKSVLTEKEDLRAQGYWNCRRLWVVKANDRLDTLAYAALGDCNLWLLIAKENNITNPLTFPAKTDIGKIIIIPDTHYAN